MRPSAAAVLPSAEALLLGMRPQLVAVRNAGTVLGLARHQLLHAGPPLQDPRHPPAALSSSILVTCIHEGWCTTIDEAEALLASGAVRLSPAQDHGCVTPLAAIVSPSTPMLEIADESGRIPASLFAPLSALNGPDTRAGTRDPALILRLRERDGVLAPALCLSLEASGPLSLLPLAAQGLATGDDLHYRTTGATVALSTALRASIGDSLADRIAATPLFFLTAWMAACALILRAAEGADAPTLVTRAGGNGESFGIALAGNPRRWFTVPATPPRGPLPAGVDPDTGVTGGIGDSAVIDMLGFGGQRLAFAPEPLATLGSYAPAHHAELATQLLSFEHPTFGQPCRVGLDARKVVALQEAPLVALAMVAADGERGIVGRGLYRPPLVLFARALGGP